MNDYSSGVTPLMTAVSEEHAEIVALLLNHNADVFYSDGYATMGSALQRSFNTKKVHDPSSIPSYRWPIVDLIADKINLDFFTDKDEFVKSLLQEVNCYTRLACAVICNVELATIILRNNNDEINSKIFPYKYTALEWATIFGKIDNVKLLIEYGATFKHYYGSLYTKNLQYIDENSEVLKTFLSHDIEKSLLYFLRFGTKETVKTVLQSDIDIKKTLANGRYALLETVLMTNSRLKPNDINELGFDINVNLICPKTGESALMTAVKRRNFSRVEFLLNHGAHINNCTSKNELLELINVSLGTISIDVLKIAEILLQRGVDAQIILNKGNTLIDRCLLNSRNPIEPILAHLAMLATIDQSLLIESTRKSIKSYEMSRNHFDQCLQQLNQLKNIVLCETVTLFDLLIEKSWKLARYILNQQFIMEFHSAMKNMSDLESYYVSRLHRRVEKALERLNLEETLSQVIEVSTGKAIDRHHLIVQKIFDFLEW